MNRVVVVGNVGNDAELQYTANGTPVLEFRVASHRKRGQERETDWFRVAWYGSNAEKIAAWVVTGRLVCVAGRLESRRYEGRTYWRVVAEDVQLFGGRDDARGFPPAESVTVAPAVEATAPAADAAPEATAAPPSHAGEERDWAAAEPDAYG